MLAQTHTLLKARWHNQPHRIRRPFTRFITAKRRRHVIRRMRIHHLWFVEDAADNLAEVRMVGIVDVDLRHSSAAKQGLQKNEDDAHKKGVNRLKRICLFLMISMASLWAMA